MRRLLLFVVCATVSGCLAFAYPSVSNTPTIQVEGPDVQAFRVVSEFRQWGPWMTGPIEINQTVEKLPEANHTIASQSDAFFPYYYLAFPLAEGAHGRSLEVRLYRRGYETVSVPAVSWFQPSGRPTRPQWKKAATLEDMEKAIEEIAPRRMRESCGSPEMRRFLAQEYAWLARSEWAAGPHREEDRRRLLDKAKEFESPAPSGAK